jgi:Pyridoxamine 5'-phosphate oxidase
MEPTARPERGAKGYRFPTSFDHLLPWADAEARLESARFYWLATVAPAGTAHVRPLWGIWLDHRFYFNGHPSARWARNIARDARASIHLESAAQVLIIEGVCDDLERTNVELGARIASGWSAKYGRLVPDAAADGIFRLIPIRARGWSEDLTDGTVWTFPSAGSSLGAEVGRH